MRRIEKIPIPVMAACLGTLTLGNVYGSIGFTWLRALCMFVGTVLVLVYTAKIVFFPKAFISEYRQVIPASIYATIPMCLMTLGSYYYEKGLAFGKGIWLFAVGLHFVHILVFTGMHTYGHVIRKKDPLPLMPSWFVTYNGWLAACVTGTAMNAGRLLKGMTVYGCLIYPVLLFFIIRRLLRHPIVDGTYHTMGVLLTPCCFCLIGCINAFEHPAPALVYILYGMVLLTLLYLVTKIPEFFSYDFYPGFAGISFPMALGVVASRKMAEFLTARGWEAGAVFCTQLSGLQILIASMVVGYVQAMFIRMLLRKEKRG